MVNDLLDGKSYCRTVQSNGMMGQPSGEREHCIEFSEGNATDNANTFFGNPPRSFKYTLKDSIVTFGHYKYGVAKDYSWIVSIAGSTLKGTVFELK